MFLKMLNLGSESIIVPTESTLLKIINDILLFVDSGDSVMFLLLDLTTKSLSRALYYMWALNVVLWIGLNHIFMIDLSLFVSMVFLHLDVP